MLVMRPNKDGSFGTPRQRANNVVQRPSVHCLLGKILPFATRFLEQSHQRPFPLRVVPFILLQPAFHHLARRRRNTDRGLLPCNRARRQNRPGQEGQPPSFLAKLSPVFSCQTHLCCPTHFFLNLLASIKFLRLPLRASALIPHPGTIKSIARHLLPPRWNRIPPQKDRTSPANRQYKRGEVRFWPNFSAIFTAERILGAWLRSSRWRDAHFWTVVEVQQLLKQARFQTGTARGCVYYPPFNPAADVVGEHDQAFSFWGSSARHCLRPEATCLR